MRWRWLGILAGIALFLGIVYFSTNLADYVPPFRTTLEDFSAKMSWPSDMTNTIGIVGLLLVILVPLTGRIYDRNRKLKTNFDVMWKKSSSLQPEEVLGLRGKPKHGFLEYYYVRENDKIIRDRISSNKNVLVLGNPLAGKSRAVYQALNSLDKHRDVLIPRLVDINPESFQIPFNFKFWRRRVVFIDDIDKFADIQNFSYLIQAILKKKDIIIIATCRSGPEYVKLSAKMEGQLSFIFEDPVEIAKISREEADEIPKTIGAEIPSEFDGNIGSIFIKLDTMRERFRGCGGIEKGILRSIRHLYYAGVYDEREVFSIERIKRVCETMEEIALKNHEWKTSFDNLKDLGFIEVTDGEKRLQAEEAYLQYVIGNGLNHIDNLKSIKDLFVEDPEALLNIGNRAYSFGLVDIGKRDYMRIAIETYRKALKVRTSDRFPMYYALAQNNLGNAYQALAEVEDKSENCKMAIKAFQEALKFRTLERFPIQYAMTQNNLGNAYNTLAGVEDESENCKRAIETYQEALKVRTIDRFPIQYAMTQNNLGAAYQTLAEVAKVEDKSENCKMAIEAFQEALKVRTPERFSTQYATTQNNLGNAYGTLAEVEDRSKSCKKAIKAFQEALKVRTLDRFPIQYATTQNNLGNAYRTLAEVEDKSENCKRAVEAYQEALKVYTKDEFPAVHPIVERNLKILLDLCKSE